MATKLYNHIHNYLKENFQISIFEVMKLALYDKDFGYYSRKLPFGKEGDFITAPLVSQLFGEMIAANFANYCLENNINDICIIELGPGDGTLMADILNVFNKIANLIQNFQIILVENSEPLITKQKEKLSKFQDIEISWCKTIEEIKTNKPVFLIANEFFDALPIHSLIKINNAWHEQVLKLENNNLTFSYNQEIAKFNNYLNDNYPQTKDGHIIEYNEIGLEIIKKLDALISDNKGMGIVIDYGYIINQKYTSTLQSLKKHQFVDVLENLGEADITIHVDFNELHQNITKCKKLPLLTQRQFLIGSGILTRAEILSNQNPNKTENIHSGLDRLISYDQMGSLFKVLMFYS
ncbi:MAG: SAM-dependent methyltransferase [Sphingobacteriia bacterium]|nr:SAM-dependent methyltransferase [Sphingobacteriia bacterium]